MKLSNLFSLAVAALMNETGSITIWNRPAAKAANGDKSVPQSLTEEQAEAQIEFGKKLHALLTEGINDGSAAAFLTPSENGRTILVAATIPMDPLTVEVDGQAEPLTTNQWALNLNVAVPSKTPKKTDEDATGEQPKAMSFEELRDFTNKNRIANKGAKK